jgi:hypothetical protein
MGARKAGMSLPLLALYLPYPLRVKVGKISFFEMLYFREYATFWYE